MKIQNLFITKIVYVLIIILCLIATYTFAQPVNLIGKIETQEGETGFASYDNHTYSLPECASGDKYLFSGDFFRENRDDHLAYPEVTFWGEKYRLDTHRIIGKYQHIKRIVSCPESHRQKANLFEFQNNYPGTTFRVRNPQLFELNKEYSMITILPENDFYPIGVYGANSLNLQAIKTAGLNTGVVRLSEENLQECIDLDFHCTVAVPRDPEQLAFAMIQLGSLLHKGKFDYYVNDEPGIHSFPEKKAERIQQIIKNAFPASRTNMALVRPQVIPFYEKATDYFMLDQYPVPNMPMVWLSDSMDEAASYVGKGRLQSVIQSFGGEKYASSGWPRLPTFEEMNCLAFLSVVHGSRGIYFYTYPSISSTAQGKEDFSRVISRLNSLKSWLQIHNDENDVILKMTSKYKYDPSGNPAVHCASKEQYNTKMLICVNTIQPYTEAEIDVDSDRSTLWQDYFGDVPYYVAGGNILARFKPYEVKVLLESR